MIEKMNNENQLVQHSSKDYFMWCFVLLKYEYCSCNALRNLKNIYTFGEFDKLFLQKKSDYRKLSGEIK